MALNFDYEGTDDEILRQDQDIKDFVGRTGQEIEDHVNNSQNSIPALKELVATQGKMIHLLQKAIEELKGNGGL